MKQKSEDIIINKDKHFFEKTNKADSSGKIEEEKNVKAQIANFNMGETQNINVEQKREITEYKKVQNYMKIYYFYINTYVIKL